MWRVEEEEEEIGVALLVDGGGVEATDGVAVLVDEDEEDDELPAPLDLRTADVPDEAGVDSEVDADVDGAGDTESEDEPSLSSCDGGRTRASGDAPTGTATFGGLNNE